MKPSEVQPDPNIEQLKRAVKRLRLASALAALALVAAAPWLGGASWALGAALGGLAVAVNLWLLKLFIQRASSWRGRSLWPSLGRFYFFFALTALFCVLVVRQGWGDPLGFLAGLLSFVMGLAFTALTLVWRPLSKAEPQ